MYVHRLPGNHDTRHPDTGCETFKKDSRSRLKEKIGITDYKLEPGQSELRSKYVLKDTQGPRPLLT